MTYNGINFDGDYGTDYLCQYWCNFAAANWWKADRLLVLVQRPQQYPTGSLLWLSAANTTIGGTTNSVSYEMDANGYCIIDITELARTFDPSAHAISIWFGSIADQSNATVVLNTAAQGIINPERVIIPDHPLAQFGVLIEPPAKMYQNPLPTGSTTSPVTFEFRETTGEDWDLDEYDAAGGYVDVRIVEIPSCDLALDTDMIHITSQYGDGVSYRMAPRNCESKYAVVRWVSFTGATRVHVFELHKVKQTTANAYDLLNLAGEYTEIKGREDSFILSLDGLSAYDLWYYADILQSSKVEVQVKGDQPFRRVKITDNSVTIPDGNCGTHKLEINVKWQNYDAIIV